MVCITIIERPIAPTVEVIDEWLALEKKHKPEGAHYATEYASFGVNIWTKASQSRCIASKVRDQYGKTWYWTIKGEGSSNGCRKYAIPEDKIVRAVGTIVGDEDQIPDEFKS